MFARSCKIILIWGLGLTLLVAGCAHAPYTERRQVMVIPEATENSMGSRAFEDLKRRFPLCQDPAVNEMVVTVGQRIAYAADRPDFRWEFVVFENPKEANAFCLPGGKVGVFTGILEYTKDEAGLATVMAHEAAHALARHAGERQSQAMLAQMGGVGLSLGLGGLGSLASQGIMQAYGLGSQVGVLMPFSRKQEKEADRIGLILLAKAGYDPAVALDFWRRLMAKPPEKKTNLPTFLSSHPSDYSRLKAMEEYLPFAREYYAPAAAAPAAPQPLPKETPLPPQEAPAAPPPPASPAPPKEEPSKEFKPGDDLGVKPLGGTVAPAEEWGQWMPQAK